MAQILSADVIDFSAYEEETDTQQKVRSTQAYADDVVRHFHSPDEEKGVRLPWPKTHSEIRFRHGEVTLWNGYNGSGKSLILGQVCMGFLGQHEKVCIASMEMKPHVTLARLCRQAYGSELPDEAYIREFHRNTDQRLWLYDQQGTVKAHKLLAVVRYCADRLKIGHVVIDSLMKCGMGEDDYNRQKEFIDQLTAAARDYGIHIHLVTHARKGQNEHEMPGKMDVKGSGAITDQVDNVITVWRNKKKERATQDGAAASHEPDTMLICDKQRNGEWEGRVKLWYDPRSQCYRENSY